jgi:polyvinyl alcohol dehydrogenase (cytochrome)
MTGVSEESAASNPEYECCRFRGSITSLDTETGAVVWKTYTVDEPVRRGTSTAGVPLWGPAGVGIWSAPTIDAGRGLIYAATGNAYAEPVPETADAVIAIDIESGGIVWANQLLPGDAWLMGCQPGSDNPNCPEDVGPDYDFSASPLLATTAGGRDLLVVPQKSGMLYALDPENDGATVWEYRAGPGSAVGGVWGSAAGDGVAYVAVGGYFSQETGGIHAVDLETGERVWYTPPEAPLCASAQAAAPAGRGGRGGRGGFGGGCGATQSAAVTAIPGGVFSGSADGGMRFYAREDGEIVWTFDANREFETNNGVEARGGSFDGPGPVVVGGMVYMLSGNGGIVGLPGNVLLAFGVE